MGTDPADQCYSHGLNAAESLVRVYLMDGGLLPFLATGCSLLLRLSSLSVERHNTALSTKPEGRSRIILVGEWLTTRSASSLVATRATRAIHHL
jgi:hypothetical protein